MFLLLLGCGWMQRAAGQSATDAAVRGRLTDPRGVPVAAAEIRLLSLGQEDDGGGLDGAALRSAGLGFAGSGWDDGGGASQAAAAETDRRGEFALLGLEPGEYAAEVRVPGGVEWLGPVRFTAEAGETDEVELRMESGAAGLGLEVSAAPGPDRSSAAAGRSGPREVRSRGSDSAGVLSQLPVEDRQWEEVEETSSAGHDATLAGGGSARDDAEDEDSGSARADGETGSAASGLSFAGLPATENAQRVDGLSAEEAFGGGPRGAAGGGPRLGSSFAQGAVGSVRVLPHTFSAQFGGAAGGVIAVRSRRAQRGLHGSAFLQVRQSAWAATNPFAQVSRYSDGAVSTAVVKPSDSTVQFGGAAGAPLRWGVLRGREAGLFGAMEGQVRAQTLVSSPETAGFFTLTPMQSALLANRGVGAGAMNAALAYLESLTGSAVVYTPRTLGFLRLDVQPARADRLSVTAQVQRQSAPAGASQFAEGVTNRAISSIGSSEVQGEGVAGIWQHGFAVRASNSLRMQFAHEVRFETPAAATAGVPDVGPGGFAPQVAIEPQGFVYGTPATLGRVAYPDEERLEAADTVAVRWGRHVLTAGGDWSRVHERVLSATNLEGAFLYDSGTTNGRAGGLADWITDYTFNVHAYPNGGCPSIYAAVHDFCFRSYSQSFTGAPTEFATQEFAGFAEDALRAGRGLRVSLGVRYEYLLLPFPQRPNPELDSILLGLGGGAGGTTASFPEDRNNVGPRVSVAWTPRRGGGRRWFTAQAGYGLFYGRVPGATIDAALANTDLPSSTTGIRIVPTTETGCPQVAGQGFGYPCSFLSAPAGIAGQTASAMVFSRRFRLPAVQRGSLGLEHEVGRRVFVRAAYAGAWTTQLPQSVDLNIAPSTSRASYVIEGGNGWRGLRAGGAFSVPLYSARRTGLYGPVTALLSNANATYNSGTAEVQIREWHGLELRGSYTFSRAIDYGEQSSAAPRQDGQFDPFADGYDKGLSSFQVPQRFAGYAVFRSEMRGGRREVRAALSGWRLAAVGTASSGAPYSYVVFGGTRLTGGHESINGSGGATYLPTVGRNTLRLPMRAKMDVRTSREFAVWRRARVELRGDAFNLLNAVSVSRVETRAFLVGTAGSAGGLTPLVFQDAATIAAEGLTTSAFGTALSSTSGASRERQIEFGAKLSF